VEFVVPAAFGLIEAGTWRNRDASWQVGKPCGAESATARVGVDEFGNVGECCASSGQGQFVGVSMFLPPAEWPGPPVASSIQERSCLLNRYDPLSRYDPLISIFVRRGCARVAPWSVSTSPSA